MSQSALLQTVRNWLVTECGYKEYVECDVLPEPGNPPTLAGRRFVSIVGSKSAELQNRAIQERYEVRVVISLRSFSTPWQNWANGRWLDASEGIETEVRRCIQAIHGAGTKGIDLLNRANQLITDDADKFQAGIPLLFRQEIGPQPKSPAWWGNPDGNEMGIVSTLVFGYAQRIQAVDNYV